MTLCYSEQSVKDLKAFNHAERTMIAQKLRYLAENFGELRESKKVTALRGCQYEGQFRFIIARKIRAIFRVENGEMVLLILRVGKRKDVYDK